MINYLYNKSSSLDKNTNINLYARKKYAQHYLVRVTLNHNFPVRIYLLKVNNKNSRTMCKLTIKTPERRHWRFHTLF